ncbi:hypothetical protein FACS189446_4730 [Bacteroidia bacterium]|nr:hypothetical protein FACS189446_4730 [Bacteroidia bacterium]
MKKKPVYLLVIFVFLTSAMTDKKESDEGLYEWLKTAECAETMQKTDSVCAAGLQRVEGTDLYKQQGNTLLVQLINSDTYLQRSGNRYQPVYDIAYPEESLANLFITKQIKNTLTLQITHRMYGGLTPQLTIPLNRFTCLLKDDFETYCMLYHSNGETIRISVVLYNREDNYIHLLRIKTSREQIFREHGILTVDFYTHIPLYNLKSLFQN